MGCDDYSTVKNSSSIPLDPLFAEKDTNDVPCVKKQQQQKHSHWLAPTDCIVLFCCIVSHYVAQV